MRIQLALFLLAGCGGTTDEAPKPVDKPVEAPKPIESPKPAVPWSTSNDAALAKLQGAWLVKGFGSYGAVSAWRFDGAKVTVYNPDKKTETPDVLLFESPCAVRLDSGYGGTLVIDGGGTKQGDTIIACMGSGTVYATPKGCATYKQSFRTVEVIETTCATPEGRFVATEKSNYGETSLRFWNDHILLTDQLASNKLQRFPDFAAAKAAADQVIATHKP
jgi:hypothetical protein